MKLINLTEFDLTKITLSCLNLEEIINLQFKNIKNFQYITILKPFILHEPLTHNIQSKEYVSDINTCFVLSNNPYSNQNPYIDRDFDVIEISDNLKLHEADDLLQKNIKQKLILEGVRLINKASSYISYDATLKNNTIIYPNCYIGRGTDLDSVSVLSGSFIEDCTAQSGSVIGTNARIRGRTLIGKNTKIGNLAEIKNSVIGNNTSISHFSYIGDSEIGSNVNIGAGVVICNYDGKNKHKTVIGDKSFIGANTTLIAPLICKEGSFIAAGSVINKNVSSNCLTINRASNLKEISNYKNLYLEKFN